MKLFNIGKKIAESQRQAKQADELKNEADSFQLAGDGGYIRILKYALFFLFAYYNARLFIVTVPGWEGYLTAVFALAGEATALYCINNFNRSSGAHQAALGVFGALLTIFSLTHATISWFRMEDSARLSTGIKFYCETIAFPLLFSLLLLAAIVIPLLHWKRKVAAEQAKAQVDIKTRRAQIVAEASNLRAESELERERLANFEEQIAIGNEYVAALSRFAKMKKAEADALAEIPDPELRRQIAESFGATNNTPAQKQVVAWRGGQQVDNQRGN